jgi:hypothetical protein
MRGDPGKLEWSTLWLSCAVVACLAGAVGCGSMGGALGMLPGYAPFQESAGATPQSSVGGPASGQSGFFETGVRSSVDPCLEPEARKLIRISMRNLSSDYIHYFLVLIAYVNGEVYPDGAVCPDDVALYTSFDYQEIPEGAEQAFGNYCIRGPALVYFHENGQFQRGGGVGGARLASAIGPAQGTNPTYDNFFTASGARVPVPDLILFHNPNTGEGQALKISRNSPAPCDILVTAGDPDCEQDAFYYVSSDDVMAGSNALGRGSGRRTPNEIQGTGCQCTGFQDPYQHLAPSGTSPTNALCYEFLRGGFIEYIFVRDDREPPYPQLLWRVADESGNEVHEFDPRAGIP